MGIWRRLTSELLVEGRKALKFQESQSLWRKSQFFPVKDRPHEAGKLGFVRSGCFEHPVANNVT